MTRLLPKNQFLSESAGQFSSSSPADDEIDIGALLSTIWRGKLFIAFLTLVMLFIGGFYAYFIATPSFRSTSVIILETKQKQIVDLGSVVDGLTGDDSEVTSELEVLKSRQLIGKVVDRLDLMNDPEFNPKLRPPSRIDLAKQQVLNKIYDVTGIQRHETPAISSEIERKMEHDAVVTELLRALSMQNVRNSLVFQITAQTQDPEKSAKIADTIAQLYVTNQLEVKFEATEQATKWLTERVSTIKVQLEEAEQKLAEFNSSTELVSVPALQGQEVQLKDLRERILEAQTKVAESSARVKSLQETQGFAERSKIANDPELSELALTAKADEASAARFEQRYAQIVTRAELQNARQQQQLAVLTSSAAELESQIERQNDDLIKLQQFKRESEAVRLLYEYFLTRLNETAAQRGIQQADSRILSDAVLPISPSAPRKKMIMAMFGLIGIAVGTGLVLLREANRNTGFRTARDLESNTGQTVLGQIPQIPARNRKRILAYLAEKPTSAAAEAVRNLRTSVMLSNVDNPPKVIMSTSSVPGEGKTTVSLALSDNLIGLGKKVLLIEGDIRRRTFSQYFQNIPKNGLVAAVTGESEIDDVIMRNDGFGPDVIAGDKSNLNAADIFASEKFRNLVRELRNRYDVIVIDTPPVLVVPDARIIAQVTDAVLFTVRWDHTSRQQVEEALRMFRDSDQTVTGLILSQISPKKMKKYGYGGNYGAYGEYGGKYYNS